jgi:hypothetical protein
MMDRLNNPSKIAYRLAELKDIMRPLWRHFR